MLQVRLDHLFTSILFSEATLLFLNLCTYKYIGT